MMKQIKDAVRESPEGPWQFDHTLTREEYQALFIEARMAARKRMIKRVFPLTLGLIVPLVLMLMIHRPNAPHHDHKRSGIHLINKLWRP